MKERISVWTALAAFILGWGLTIAGFVVEPVGEVADSVLWILGQALIYAASVFGITNYFHTESTKLRQDVKRLMKNEEIEDGEE